MVEGGAVFGDGIEKEDGNEAEALERPVTSLIRDQVSFVLLEAELKQLR